MNGNVLAIDTSTLTASVAVARDGRVVASRETRATTHSEQLLPLIDELLVEAGLVVGDLGVVACGAGPGSFTGLRIGLATAKGIAYAVRCPLHLASSLELLAAAAEESAVPPVAILSVLDARKKEVYVGLYERTAEGGLTLVGDEVVCAPSRIAEMARGRRVVVVGDGTVVYPAESAAAGTVLSAVRPTPDAAVLARLTVAGRTREAALHSASPSYVRKSEAELKWTEKKQPKG